MFPTISDTRHFGHCFRIDASAREPIRRARVSPVSPFGAPSPNGYPQRRLGRHRDNSPDFHEKRLIPNLTPPTKFVKGENIVDFELSLLYQTIPSTQNIFGGTNGR
jgi:hypothetical protein